MANILFIIKYKNPSIGGVERVTYELVNSLKKIGHSCYLAYYRDEDKLDNVNFFFPESSSSGDLIKGILPYINERNIEVVISQDQNSQCIIDLIKYLKHHSDIKLINCHHNQPDFPKHWKMPLRFRVTEFLYRIRNGYSSYAVPYRELYNNTDRFVLLSKSFIPLARKCYALKDSSRLRAISNPISPVNSDGVIPFENKKKQVLIVSRLFDNQKNLTAALRIWNKFEKLHEDYTLLIAGTGPDEEMLKKYSRSLGNKRVSFIGHQNNPETLYNESRFFMMTSRYEGFGMTLIEAQRYGCIPFVFDSYLSLRDIVKDKVNGFILKNCDENQYVRAMDAAVKNPDISRISTDAIRNVARFDSDTIVAKWNELIMELMNHECKIG